MPLFDYECESCRKSVEVLVRNGESPECPACGSQKMTRQLSAPAAPHGGSGRDLPMAENCGLPQCGRGMCGGM